MTKILNRPQFKPITCAACKCEYEYEEGDSVNSIVSYSGAKSIYDKQVQLVSMTLSCPVCGYNNNLHLQD